MSKVIADYFDVDFFRENSLNLFNGDLRLNAEYYLHDNNFNLPDNIARQRLSEIASVLGFGPFKRFYIENVKFGVPLISSSEMMEINPSCEGIISKELVKDYQKYLVKPNTILVSCSGTIGNITLVDSRLAGKAVSQHALRVIPIDKVHVGLLYTFLNSEYGQSIIKGKKSGAVIDEIYEDDLNIIEIPVIDDSAIKKLNECIVSAFEKRDRANAKLENAKLNVLSCNNLPTLSDIEVQILDVTEQSRIRLAASSEFSHDFRFDAHYYSNLFKNTNETLKINAPKYVPLCQVADNIFMGNRFTRVFVDSANGVPFIGTKNSLQIRPTELKFLSKTETPNLDKLILEEGWILLARSGSLGGTFGKVSFVRNNFEGYAGSEHIIRVCADKGKIDSGYLYAYLSSPYGYLLITQLRHGALIDEIDPEDLGQILVPIPDEREQKAIGDLVRQAFDLRAEAIRLEDEAQVVLTNALIPR